MRRARRVPLPADSSIAGRFAGADLADAYSIAVPAGIGDDVSVLARSLFTNPPRWFRGLLRIRDALMGLTGVKTSSRLRAELHRSGAERIDFFKVQASTDREVVLGEDDRHLDFRVSVLLRPAAAPAAEKELVVATAVQCHNLLGRAYLAAIAPFHRLVVRSFLQRAADAGWQRPTA